MRIPAKTYFRGLQWVGLLTLFLISIFVHRPTALMVFGALLIWKVYIQWQLPARMFKRLDRGRLNDPDVRSSFIPLHGGVKTQKTKLHHLLPPWPTILLLEHNEAHVFFGPLMAKKLTTEDLQILRFVSEGGFEARLPQLGLKFYGYLNPLLTTLRWLDQRLKFSSFERIAFHGACLITLPLQQSWAEIWKQAAEKYSSADCFRLRRKLANFMAAHQTPLPSEFAFLCLDMHLAIPQRESTLLEWPQLQPGKSKRN